MRAAGTYFEQVPKTVIEKILAQQNSAAEIKMGGDVAVKTPAASNAPNRATFRSPKP
jgi:hypothetical protein